MSVALAALTIETRSPGPPPPSRGGAWHSAGRTRRRPRPAVAVGRRGAAGARAVAGTRRGSCWRPTGPGGAHLGGPSPNPPGNSVLLIRIFSPTGLDREFPRGGSTVSPVLCISKPGTGLKVEVTQCVWNHGAGVVGARPGPTAARAVRAPFGSSRAALCLLRRGTGSGRPPCAEQQPSFPGRRQNPLSHTGMNRDGLTQTFLPLTGWKFLCQHSIRKASEHGGDRTVGIRRLR